MAVTLTESAARHVNRYLGKRGKGVGVRLGVEDHGLLGPGLQARVRGRVRAGRRGVRRPWHQGAGRSQEPGLHRRHAARLRARGPERRASSSSTRTSATVAVAAKASGSDRRALLRPSRHHVMCWRLLNAPMNLNDTDFELFAVPATFAQDRAALDARWKELQREAHPDRFATQGAAAQRVAAAVVDAHQRGISAPQGADQARGLPVRTQRRADRCRAATRPCRPSS